MLDSDPGNLNQDPKHYLQHVAGAGGLYSVLLTAAATAGIPGAEPAVAARLLGGAPVAIV